MNFRNHVVTVVLLGAGTVSFAVGLRSFVGLVAILTLIPASGFFFLVDNRLLDHWRGDMMARWTRQELELAAFRAALRAHPGLPKESMEAMLATLPATEDLVAEQRILPPAREAAARRLRARDGRRAVGLLLNLIASVVAVASLLTALLVRNWIPLLALTLVSVLAAVAHRFRAASSNHQQALPSQ